MTTTLSLALSNPAMAPESFWIALEQDLPDELATVAEAARVIDEAFEIDPCAAPTEDPQPEELPSLDEMLATAREIMALSLAAEYPTLCSDSDGGFAATVLVARSHQDRPYTLLVAGGEVEQTITGNVKEIVKTVAVSSISSISLDLPADQQITVAWAGPCYAESGRLEQPPAITVSNCRISWDGAITGTLLVAWAQPYDILTIQAAGQDCTVTALYHLATDEISLQPPPADEQAETLCRQLSSSIDTPDGTTGSCTEAITVEVRCECTDEKTADSYIRLMSMPCLPGELPGSVVNRGRVEVEYKRCSGQEDDVHDPDFYEATCCQPWPWFSGPYQRDLPRCREKYGPYTQGEQPTDLLESLIKTYGDDIAFVPVGPDDGICGQTITVQDVNQRNCCDGVQELAWDAEKSIEVVDINGDVYVTGGQLSIIKRWQVRGHGFYTDSAHTKKDAETSGNRLRIYVSDEACGTAAIYVTDGCSSASGMVRSIMGRWEAVDPAIAPYDDVQATGVISISLPPTLCSARAVVRIEAVTGKYRYRQTYLWAYSTVAHNTSSYGHACNCDPVSPDWQAGAAVIAGRHTMVSGDRQLINPFSGAQLLPMDNMLIWQGALMNPTVPEKESDDSGIGMSKHCHYVTDYFGRSVWDCTTAGGTLYADATDSHCQDTDPTAEIWVC